MYLHKTGYIKHVLHWQSEGLSRVILTTYNFGFMHCLQNVTSCMMQLHCNDCEHYCLLGCVTVQSDRCLLVFQRNVVPLSLSVVITCETIWYHIIENRIYIHSQLCTINSQLSNHLDSSYRQQKIKKQCCYKFIQKQICNTHALTCHVVVITAAISSGTCCPPSSRCHYSRTN